MIHAKTHFARAFGRPICKTPARSPVTVNTEDEFTALPEFERCNRCDAKLHGRRPGRAPLPLSPEQAAGLVQLAASMEFVFASTMPEMPHWYAKRTRANGAAFDELWRAVLKYGVLGYYEGRRNRYLALPDGFKYWLIPPSPVINRDREPVQLEA
jgi:hypothetical protein